MIDYSLPHGVTANGLACISTHLLMYRTTRENKLLQNFRSPHPSVYNLCQFLNLATSVPCRPIFNALTTGPGLMFQFCNNRTALATIQSLGGKYMEYNAFMYFDVSPRTFAFSEDGVNFLKLRMLDYVHMNILMPKLTLALAWHVKDLFLLIREYI